MARMAAVLVFAFSLAAFAAEKKGEAEHVASLVRQLGSGRYADREAATEALDALGAAAVPALKQAVRGDDPEVSWRAEALVARIESRLETARLLQPKRVRFVFKDTPLAEAVEHLKRQTGFAIQLGKDTALAQRKVTLDTGEVTFWEAFEQFCNQSNLVERPVAPVSNEVRTGADGNGVVFRQLVTRHQYAGNLDRGITLHDGKPTPRPTCFSGAIRVRALPGDQVAGHDLRSLGETLFKLEVTPEPKMPWQGVLELRVNRAVDENGRLLTPATGPAGQGMDQDIRLILEAETMRIESPTQFPVRLKVGDKPAKLLKELKGTVTAHVQTPPETLLAVDDVLQTNGQTIKGADGSAAHITEATKRAGGQINLRLMIELPPQNNLAWNGAAQFRVAGRFGNVPQPDTAGSTWTLFDAQGKTFYRVGLNESLSANANGGWSQDVRLTFKDQQGAVAPFKLVRTGRRLAIVEVPFALSDVPLL